MIRTMESAVVEICFRGMSFIVFILILTMSPQLAHAQIGLTLKRIVLGDFG